MPSLFHPFRKYLQESVNALRKRLVLLARLIVTDQVRLMRNLVEIVRQASQRTDVSDHFLRQGFLDVAVDGKLIDEFGEGLALTLLQLLQLCVVQAVEADFHHVVTTLAERFPGPSALVWCAVRTGRGCFGCLGIHNQLTVR